MSDVARDFADAHRLSHLLWEVSARASSLTEAALADTPLSPASSGVLDVVAAKPGTSIAEMARWLPTSAQGISQIVARLERLGLLERRLGARGHGVALFVTEEGARAREAADTRIHGLETKLAKELGQREHDQLIELLDHARVVLERFDAQPGPASGAREA